MDEVSPSQDAVISSAPHQSSSSTCVTVPIHSVSGPAFDFCETRALIVMLQAAEFSLVERLSEDAVNRFLRMEIAKLELNAPNDPNHLQTAQDIPRTIGTVLIRLGLSQEIIHSTCCPSCFSIYPPPIRPTAHAIHAKKPFEPPSVTHCTSKFYSTSKRYVKSLNGESPSCGAALFKSPPPNGDYPYAPIKTFSYRTLADWIACKICYNNFEDLLDSSLFRSDKSSPTSMTDVWDGSVWKTFPDSTVPPRPYTSISGNLVFSLFVDWFNPFRGKHQAPVSVGAIVLVCLNLPPSQRYREENLFLFGIIPGPSEPSVFQINGILRPLVEELQQFWKGVWFDRSFRHPRGRLVKAVIFPLIADLPALRKTAGFTAHSAKNFCSYCQLTSEDINLIDPKQFKARDHESHMAQSTEWNQATTHAEKETVSDKQGVRYSALNDLPYWRPIEFCGIELMHSFILGNLKDHAHSFLGLLEAGVVVKKTYKRRHNLQLSDRNTHPFDLLVQSKANDAPNGKRKQPDEDVRQPSPTKINPPSTRSTRKRTAQKRNQASKANYERSGSCVSQTSIPILPNSQDIEVSQPARTKINLPVKSRTRNRKISMEKQGSQTAIAKASSHVSRSAEKQPVLLPNQKNALGFAPSWRIQPKLLRMPKPSDSPGKFVNEAQGTSHQHKKHKKLASAPHSYTLRPRPSQDRHLKTEKHAPSGKKRQLDDLVCDTQSSPDARPSKISKNEYSNKDDPTTGMCLAHLNVMFSMLKFQGPTPHGTETLEETSRQTRYYLRLQSTRHCQNIASGSKDSFSTSKSSNGSHKCTSTSSSTNYSSSNHISDKSDQNASSSNAESEQTDDGTICSTDTVKASKTTKRVEKAQMKTELKALSLLDPKILPAELEAVHKCISTTRVPSWMTRVKKTVGTPGNNSLKAAEWLILYSVYFTLTLIPIWKLDSENPHREALLSSTVDLISMTNFLTSRNVQTTELDWYSNTMINYRTTLSNGWKGQAQSKPNLHISQHYPEHIIRFGPPGSTASWAHERLNGILGRISTNNRLGISRTSFDIFQRSDLFF
jgi:hypothetical protein